MHIVVRYLIYFLRLLLACICGGAVGYERKNQGKGAGIRTHSIVAVSAALMMIVSKYCFADIADFPGLRGADPARIAAQVVSGVGFLGDGKIYFNNHSIKGLTTAAGIWATAGIGLALGSGMYGLGIFAAVLIVVFQLLLRKLEKMLRMPNEEMIKIVITDDPETMEFITAMLAKFAITIESTNCKRLSDNRLELELMTSVPSGINYNEVLNVFRENKAIYEIDI